MRSSRFQFALATAADDAQLRHRMAADWLRGNLSVSFRREPSYFAACAVQGDTSEVFCCRDTATGELVMMASRSIRQALVNGVPQRLGYIGDIRLAPEHRNGIILGRAARFLRRLHQDNPVPLYFGIILDGNQAALDAFTRPRAGLPALTDLGRILTPAIHLDLPRRSLREPGLSFEMARADQLEEVAAFLSRANIQKQFAPCIRSLQGAPDLLLAIRNNRIVGCCAGWDQRSFRQTHIEAYSRSLALLRPVYNFAAALLPLKRLPAPGSALPYLYLSFVAIEENDPRIFRLLLREFYCRHRSGPWHYVIAGLHERDPLAAVLQEYRRIDAGGRLFAVNYDDGAQVVAGLDGRVPYIEMATV